MPAAMHVSVVYPQLKNAKRLMEVKNLYPREVDVERLDLLAATYQKMAWMFRRAGDLKAALECMQKAVDMEWTAGQVCLVL